MPKESEDKDQLSDILYQQHQANPLLMPLVDPFWPDEERDIYFTDDGKQSDKMFLRGKFISIYSNK